MKYFTCVNGMVEDDSGHGMAPCLLCEGKGCAPRLDRLAKSAEAFKDEDPKVISGAYIEGKKLQPEDIGLPVTYTDPYIGSVPERGFISSYRDDGTIFVRFKGETGQNCHPPRLTWTENPIFQVRYEKGNSHTIAGGIAQTHFDALRMAHDSAVSMTSGSLRPEQMVRVTVVRRMGSCALCGLMTTDLGIAQLHSGDIAELCRSCSRVKPQFKRKATSALDGPSIATVVEQEGADQ